MREIYLYGGILTLSLALFWLAPGIDLFVSRLFYDPQHGFTWAAWPPLLELEDLVRWITWAILATILVGTVWLRLTQRPLWRLDRNALIFLLAALVLGPGIVANTILKDHWGRARPYQIIEFGGAKSFTPAPLPADQCGRNCSFVSGHAALGFSLVSFVFLLPAGRQRQIALGVALGFGALIGLGRIAAGHHFLSDVVDAGLIVVGITWLLHWWLVAYDGTTPIIAFADRLAATPGGKGILCTATIVVTEAIAIVWIDRPVADFFHADGGAMHPVFDAVQRFGLGYPYLALSALAFVVLRWGGRLDKLKPRDAAMRANAYIPAFIFAAIAASGLIVDLLKVLIGRSRPKLLFANGTYDLTWFGWHPDHWSFPSGHAATAAALATALWCLWPRPFWLYVAFAALVATSRVVIGQHFLSDVIAGAVIGIATTRLLAAWLLRPRLAGAPTQDAAPDYRAV